jgi:ribulose-5-phosphate 4-epimerase/fuculose-1-phosphate aldolase
MAKVSRLKLPSVRDQVSEEEWAVRVDLAALYRLVAHFGWDDLIFTHHSARVPGAEDHFLINPFGLMFNEITASSLLKVDVEGKLVMESEYPYLDAGFAIHSAVHMARHDLACVMHTHTVAGMAVAAQAGGLLSINQKSMPFHNRIGYHDYEGIAGDLDERQRIAANMGNNKVVILRNHGLLAAGSTVSEAFMIMRTLEEACKAQIAAQSGGGDLVFPSEKVCEHTAQQFEKFMPIGATAWTALLRMLDHQGANYAE